MIQKEDWENVIWSDETKIELFGKNSTCRVWRRKNAELHPKNTIPTVKHRGWKHHALGLFFCKGTRTTDPCKGKMNGAMYREILSENLLPSAKGIEDETQSPDLNSIENLLEGVESLCCPATAPKHHCSRGDLHGGMGQNIQQHSFFTMTVVQYIDRITAEAAPIRLSISRSIFSLTFVNKTPRYLISSTFGRTSPPTRRGHATLFWSRTMASDLEVMILIPAASHSGCKSPQYMLKMYLFFAGTLDAACELMRKQQAEILGCMVVIELKELNGIARLKPHSVFSLVQY
ncbi:hypothetical protein L3Q82_011504 [Scortum barcoo]|uniref:Uncharacterized protein n=1 Tax=Scortum barcoo TaxID=214431 RepID=A0ACB8W592_9TELE|nr:hypothetical protein L3Q82_011504 [Scortum barcoo]